MAGVHAAQLSICIGYYTVDCTIPTYIWTSAQMTTIGTVNCIITLLLYIQLFKENVTFKLHVVLIVLPCKQNVTYIRFFF